MKLFALNLSLEFVSPNTDLNYRYEPIKLKKLKKLFPDKLEFEHQQFYVPGKSSDTFVRKVFKLQSDEDWRETPLSIRFIFPDEFEKEKFLGKFIPMFKQVDAAGGLVQNEKGEYLCIFNRNRWTLPKGHVEENEEISVAALREVQEETGLAEVFLQDEMPKTFHTFKKKKKWILKITYWYKMKASSQQILEPQAEEHIEAVAWMSKEKWLSVAAQSYPLTRDLFVTEFTQRLT